MSASSSPTLRPGARQRHRQVDRHGRFADAALAGRDGDDRFTSGSSSAGFCPPRGAALRAAGCWPVAACGAGLCAVSTAVALVTPGWAASTRSTSRRTGSIAAASARSVSSATCTRPPRSSIPSIQPGGDDVAPGGIADPAEGGAQAVGGGDVHR